MATIGGRHPALARLRRLARQRRARQEQASFVIEGTGLLGEALAAGVTVEEVFVVAGAPEPADLPTGAVRHTVEADRLARACSVRTVQDVVAVARIPDPWPGPGLVPAGSVLVLAGVGDPGNAGTLVRVAEAAGMASVLFCGDAVDPWNPRCVRASAGSVFRVPIVVAGLADVVTALADRTRTVVAATAGGDRAHSDVDLTGDLALLLGSEAHGLPAELAALEPDTVRIPMHGAVESLNVATAGAVLAFEAARQRRERRERVRWS